VLGSAALLVEQAQLLRGGAAGFLKIAASPQIIESVLPAFLHRYASKFPDVKVKLSEAVGRDQLTMLECGDADISIGLLGAIHAADHFTSYQLPAVEILAACQPSQELGDCARIEIGQLASYPLLLLDSTYVFRKSFDAACRLAGFEPNIMIESRAPHTLLALAEAGYGVAIVQTAVPIRRYRLRIAHVTYRHKPIRFPMAVIWDKRRTLPRYVEDFYKLLGHHMQKVFPIAQPSK
jgi:DNA-binding transcriptional LysR family regulator